VTIEKSFYVYILTNKRNGTLYTGVTSDLEQRIWDHKHNVYGGFTKRYKVHMLVYYKDGGDALTAIRREKQIKKWRHNWRIQLIEKHNPEWKDLYDKQEGIHPLPIE
jgi:putative endonuclease